MPALPEKPRLQQRVAGVILEGAASAFAERGPSASMSDVAEAAGVARATVYRYYANRELLLAAVLDEGLRLAGDELAAARLDEVEPEEAVTRVVRALIEAGDPLMVLVRERARPAGFAEALATPLVAVVERARAMGELRDDLPVAWLVETLLGLVLSIAGAAPQRGREDTIAGITSLFLDGTRPGGPRLR